MVFYLGKVEILVSLPLSLNMAFSTTLVPSISSSKAIGDKSEVNRKIIESLIYTLVIAIPCMLGLIIFAEPILKLLFPNASSGCELLEVSSISVIFLLLIQTMSGALQGLGKIMIPVFALGLSAILKLILNVLLIPIPSLGIMGAAISSVISDILCFIVLVIKMKKYIYIEKESYKKLLKLILANILMIFSTYFVYDYLLKTINIQNICLIISIIFAGVTYIVLIKILKIFKKN